MELKKGTCTLTKLKVTKDSVPDDWTLRITISKKDIESTFKSLQELKSYILSQVEREIDKTFEDSND